MEMKYYRFLYGENAGCFAHFGQIRDTKTEERFSFLYLKSIEGHVSQKQTERPLFLYPEAVDLVVLGCADEDVKAALKELLVQSRVGMVVMPEISDFTEQEPENWETAEKEKLWVWENFIPQETEVIRLSRNPGENTYCRKAAGWKFLAAMCDDGCIALAHGLVNKVSEEPETDAASFFDDCVMSVKRINDEKTCKTNCTLSGYARAFGCALYQDNDMCKCLHGSQEVVSGCVLGTVILPNELSAGEKETFTAQLRGELPDFRFIGIAGMPGADVCFKRIVTGGRLTTDKIEEAEARAQEAQSSDGEPEIFISEVSDEKVEYKQYFIGTREEFADEQMEEISLSGLNHVPVVLGRKEAVCCSGLLKYSL